MVVGVEVVIFFFRNWELMFEHEKVGMSSLFQQLGGAVGHTRDVNRNSDGQMTKLDDFVLILLVLRGGLGVVLGLGEG